MKKFATEREERTFYDLSLYNEFYNCYKEDRKRKTDNEKVDLLVYVADKSSIL